MLESSWVKHLAISVNQYKPDKPSENEYFFFFLGFSIFFFIKLHWDSQKFCSPPLNLSGHTMCQRLSYLGPSPGGLCKSGRVKGWTPLPGAWSSLCWILPADPRLASRVAARPAPGRCCWRACRWKWRPAGELQSKEGQVRATYSYIHTFITP